MKIVAGIDNHTYHIHVGRIVRDNKPVCFLFVRLLKEYYFSEIYDIFIELFYYFYLFIYLSQFFPPTNI